MIKEKVKKSDVFFVKRISCTWGGFSLVEAELNLFDEAIKKKYKYYYLLSGSDLPIKSQKVIHEFFDKNSGKEFVGFQNEKFNFSDRVRYYYPFQDLLGRKGMKYKKIFIFFQKLFVNRNRKVLFQKGTNWVSVTDDFARYIVSKRNWIKSVFKYTLCSDELFVQTLLINSKFKDNLYKKGYCDNYLAHMRLIDWEKGSPYTFKKEDYNDLINSDALFARKFDLNVDAEIIRMIKNSI